MRAILPGRPPPKQQALCTALWDGLRVIAYISGNAIIVLGGPQQILQTIYVDDVESLSAVTVEETSGAIAACGGQNVYIYEAFGREEDVLRWSQVHILRSPENLPTPVTLSWGSSEELLVGGENLVLWYLPDSDAPSEIWQQRLANSVKLARFSPDAGLIASTGQQDRLVKIWRRLSYESDNVRFDISYLRHPTTVTNMHWRKPWHAEQNLDNLLYTMCADNKIRVWAHSDPHGLRTMDLWHTIDMNASIQPRRLSVGSVSDRRYGFVVDSRDFSVATEKAVQVGSTSQSQHALEHLIEIATRSPEVCIVLDGKGHMSAWGLENVGLKNKKLTAVFNVAHVEGINISFGRHSNSDEDYVQIQVFAGGCSESSLTFLVHYFDGRIAWFDAQITKFFDTAPIQERLDLKASWSGHDAPIKKIVRSVSGRTAMSRTNDNHAVIWSQRKSVYGPVLSRQSSLDSTEHIRRSCIIADGDMVVNLHHESISLWDTRSTDATLAATCDFTTSSKPLCILKLPSEPSHCFVASICADLGGIVWEIMEPGTHGCKSNVNGSGSRIRQFCDFKLDLPHGLEFVLPVDPAGCQVQTAGFLDVFAADVAMSYSTDGTMNMFTAKVHHDKEEVEWFVTSTIETGVTNPSLASASAIRKAALVDQERTGLTIWDTFGAQLEFEDHYPTNETIQDLDWTSTPDDQSILAVGFPNRVLLLSQLRYNYLSQGPAWCVVHEVRIRELTNHPIGDSCWLGQGHLIIGAGNQLFVFDRQVEVVGNVLHELRLSSKRNQTRDLFDIVRQLNGPLPVFHPQFLGQCLLCGKADLVHKILIALHKKLKFWSEGDEIQSFLDLPIHTSLNDLETEPKFAAKEMDSSIADFSLDEEERAVTEEVAIVLNENLARVTLDQISSREQIYLADILECVAAVEKHRRSMDPNAARYILFYRHHMLRRTQLVDEAPGVTWREIVWAFHSGSQDMLLDLVSRSHQGKMLWEHARESGMFMWLTDITAMKAQLEVIARNEYTSQDDRSPIGCSLFYLALKKKQVLQGLWRMYYSKEQSATMKLLANNFTENRWKTTARKNAYALLSKRRFEYAAAFFLLGDALQDAVSVCLHQLKDVQLAVTIARAYDGDDSPVLHSLITEHLLPQAAETGNRWMASWAFWVINRRDKAVRCLISPIHALVDDTPASEISEPPSQTVFLQAKSYLSTDPALVVLYKQLREKSLTTLKGALMITPREEWDFILQNARLYSRMGCDLLALDLVRNWEFLLPQPKAAKRQSVNLDPRKLLRRRSSLVVDDIQHALEGSDVSQGQGTKSDGPHKATEGAKKPPPTVFEEPTANSLLDSFGF